ncbi:MAG: flagellar hook assembly protein FlgD [Alteromonadaceae bacterium]|nr:flagellar hook assembly protein FlgD [Alteromonadaceae bacterium]
MESVKSGGALDGLRWQKDTKPVAKERNDMLTQADFFALLTQELSYQDPTKPVDNNEMISQMTGFSTTDGISKLNDKFEGFASMMGSSQALQASSLVGRSVLVDDNRFEMIDGDTTKGKLKLDQPASNVMVFVEDSSGAVVQQVPLGDVSRGEFGFEWDGKLANGQQAGAGFYRFRVAALVDGQASELQALTYRNVDSVTLSGAGGQVQLNLQGGNSMALSDVVEISQG